MLTIAAAWGTALAFTGAIKSEATGLLARYSNSEPATGCWLAVLSAAPKIKLSRGIFRSKCKYYGLRITKITLLVRCFGTAY
jgi:hypothetical protein